MNSLRFQFTIGVRVLSLGFTPLPYLERCSLLKLKHHLGNTRLEAQKLRADSFAFSRRLEFRPSGFSLGEMPTPCGLTSVENWSAWSPISFCRHTSRTRHWPFSPSSCHVTIIFFFVGVRLKSPTARAPPSSGLASTNSCLVCRTIFACFPS